MSLLPQLKQRRLLCGGSELGLCQTDLAEVGCSFCHLVAHSCHAACKFPGALDSLEDARSAPLALVRLEAEDNVVAEPEVGRAERDARYCGIVSVMAASCATCSKLGFTTP